MGLEFKDLLSKYKYIERRESYNVRTPLHPPGDILMNVIIYPSDFKVKNRYDPKTKSLVLTEDAIE